MDCLPRFSKPRRTNLVTVAALALTSFFHGTPNVHAFAAPGGYQNGAPFSNGSFFPTSGTFQATIRGKNLSGVAVFSTYSADSASEAPSTGIFSVNFNGVTYSGNVNGSIDTAASQIAAILEASVERSGEGQLVTTIGLNQQVLTNFETETETETVVEVTSSGTTTTTTTNTTTNIDESLLETEYTATSDYNDVLYVSGSFTADLFPTYPQQAFKGSGSLTFQELELTFSETNSSALAIPQLSTTKVNIKVDGVRTSDSTQTYTTQAVEIPYVLTTYQVETTTIE